MEPSTGRIPSAAVSGPRDGLPPMVTAAPCPPWSDSLLDGEKTGATLLFSGVFLTLVGVVFTTMGWQHYLVNATFEWTQLLGPILISVGGTFMLTSLCRFLSCKPRDEEAPVAEQTPAGRSFMLSGVNQQVVLCGTAAMHHFPPVYNFVREDVRQAIEFRPGGSVSGIHGVLIPPRDSACCAHNAAFTAEEADGSAHGTERSR